MYIFYYKKYNPVRCAHTQYKGYLFIKCFEAGGDHTQGGVYVVDDTATNKFGDFDVYAINGKAITHRITLEVPISFSIGVSSAPIKIMFS